MHDATGQASFRILEAGPERMSEWDVFLAQTDHATIYHTTAWAKILKEVFNYRFKLIVCVDHENRILAGVPLFSSSWRRQSKWTSVPLRDRGGILFQDEDALATLLEHLTIAQNVHLELKHLFPLPALAEGHLQKHTYWITSRITLDTDSEKIWSLTAGKARQPTRFAIKSNVQMHEWNDAAGVSAFYDLFLATRKRLGVPAYPKALFTSILQHLEPLKQCRFLFAKHKEDVISGVVLFCYKDTVIYAYAASFGPALIYKPNDFLIWKSIEWACQNNYQYFDFGADSPHQKSLLDFKAKWGAKRHPITCYTTGAFDMKIRDPDDPAYRLVRSCLQKLPMPFYKLASRFILQHYKRS